MKKKTLNCSRCDKKIDNIECYCKACVRDIVRYNGKEIIKRIKTYMKGFWK